MLPETQLPVPVQPFPPHCPHLGIIVLVTPAVTALLLFVVAETEAVMVLIALLMYVLRGVGTLVTGERVLVKSNQLTTRSD